LSVPLPSPLQQGMKVPTMKCDEYTLIMLPDTDIKEARTKAKKIRKATAGNVFIWLVRIFLSQ